MLWPEVDEVRRAPWRAEPAWEDGPPLADVVLLLRPAVRGLFLQGHWTTSLCFAVGAAPDQSSEWRSLDLATLSLTTELEPYPRPHTGLNVAFGLAAVGDAHGPAPEGYAMTLAETVLGIEEPMATNGKVPEELQTAAGAFADRSVAALVALVAGGRAPPRAGHQGMLWIFDSLHWQDVDKDLPAPQLVTDLLRAHPEHVIGGQVWDERRDPLTFETTPLPPSLAWLLEVQNVPDANQFFWRALYTSLQARGESHRLTVADRLRVENPARAISWLDQILELLALGVVDMDGLIEAAEPVEPLVEHAVNDKTVELTVWGEERVVVERTLDVVDPYSPPTAREYLTTIEGGAAWDYAAGTDGQPPRLAIVASRGITISQTHDPSAPWLLDVYRVEDTSTVPPVGSSIDTTLVLAPALLEPDEEELPPWMAQGIAESTGAFPKVLARPKPDGMYLEFPVWGDYEEGPDANPEKAQIGEAIPFVVELTVDEPLRGDAAYIVDVHYYTYVPFLRVGGTHICVWASEGVTIESNGAPVGAGGQAAGSSFFTEFAWEASAEFWKADFIADLNRPFAGHLEITDGLTFHASEIGSHVPRFPEGETTHVIDHRVELTPGEYTLKQYAVQDSIAFDLIDFLVGLLPFVGDVVDVAELGIAWSTGMDKWGRPVSNFELGLMTVGAAVPLISSTMVRRAADVIDPGDALILRQRGLTLLFEKARAGLAISEDDVVAALGTSRAWQKDGRISDTAGRKELVQEMLEFVSDPGNLRVVEAWAERLVRESGDEWLSLPDILKDGGGEFLYPPLNDAFLRWRKKHPGSRPEDWIASGISGRAKAIAEGLLGPESVGGALRQARRAARRSNFPSALGRLPLVGPRAKLAAIDPEKLLDDVVDIAGRAMRPGSLNKIKSTGALRHVSDVIEVDADFIRSLARKLLDHASPSGQLEDLDPTALKALVGGDKLNKKLVSQRERAARFADALIVICEEARIQGIDPAALLDSDEMLPVMKDFVRTFITRSGRENGPRFELALAALLDSMPNGPPTRHQLMLPDLLARKMRSGPDSVVYMGGRANLVQMKSFFDLGQLVEGPVTKTIVNGRIVSIKGPKLVEQTIKDQARLRHWGHKVPPAGAAAPTTIGLPDDISDWVDLGDVHVLVIDDQYLRDSTFALISDAFRRTKKSTIDVMTDLDAPEEVKALVASTMGNTIDSSDDLDQLLIEWLESSEVKEAIEGIVNSAIQADDVVEAIGRRVSYRVVFGGEPVENIPAVIRGRQ